MARINHFTDLVCWQNARKLAALVYTIDSPSYKEDWDTRNQFRRATLSIMNNIAEGFSRFSEKEQIRFYEIAQSSASEVESMLFLFEDISYLPKETIEQLFAQVRSTRYQILGLIKYLNNKNKKS